MPQPPQPPPPPPDSYEDGWEVYRKLQDDLRKTEEEHAEAARMAAPFLSLRSVRPGWPRVAMFVFKAFLYLVGLWILSAFYDASSVKGLLFLLVVILLFVAFRDRN